MRPLVAIRHHQPHELGIAGEVFEKAGVPCRYFDAWDDPAWPELDGVSGLVVLGGEMSADEEERYPFLATERALLRAAVDAEVPTLGICLGAQLLARALDAAVMPSPVTELGFRRIEATSEGAEDPILAPFDGTPVFQWHGDTFEVPAGGVRLATGEDVPNQAFRAGRACYALQFHPEATLHGIEAWADRWADQVRAMGRTPEELLAEAADRLPAQQAASLAAFGAFAELVLDRG